MISIFALLSSVLVGWGMVVIIVQLLFLICHGEITYAWLVLSERALCTRTPGELSITTIQRFSFRAFNTSMT